MRAAASTGRRRRPASRRRRRRGARPGSRRRRGSRRHRIRRRARLVVLMETAFGGERELGTPMSADTISVNVEQDRATVVLKGSTRRIPRTSSRANLAALLTERIDVAVDLRQALFIDSTVVGVPDGGQQALAGGGGRLHARGRRRDRLAGAAPARGDGAFSAAHAAGPTKADRPGEARAVSQPGAAFSAWRKLVYAATRPPPFQA